MIAFFLWFLFFVGHQHEMNKKNGILGWGYGERNWWGGSDESLKINKIEVFKKLNKIELKNDPRLKSKETIK